VPLADVADAQARLQAITQALERLGRDSEPLRRLAELAGEHLHQALSRAVEALATRIDGLAERIVEAEDQETHAREQADDAAAAAAGLQQRLQTARREHGQLQRRRDALARDGLLAAGVLATDQVAAVSEEQQSRATALATLREKLPETQERVKYSEAVRAGAQSAATQAASHAEQARTRLQALHDEVAEVATKDGLAAVLGQPEGAVALWEDPSHAADRLADHESHAQLRLAGMLAEEHAEREVIEQIAASQPGLIPPDHDCRQILSHLDARKVPAASGWRYVHESRTRDLWAESLRHCGALAAGVVLTMTDPDSADALVGELSTQLSGLRRAVPVLTSEEFEVLLGQQLPQGEAGRVVSAAPGMVDPVAAERHRVDLEESLQGAADSRAVLEAEMRNATGLRLACTALWERHPTDPRPTAQDQARTADDERAEADRQLELACDTEAQTAESLATLSERVASEERHLAALKLAHARLEPVAAEETRLTSAEHDPAALELQHDAALDRRRRALASEEQARRAHRELDGQRGALAQDRRARIAERAEITLRAPAAREEPAEDLQAARAAYAAALERWRAASTDEQLETERRASESALADAQRRRDAFEEDVLDAASQLVSSGRYDSERRQDGEDRAHLALIEAQGALGGAEQLDKQAQDAHSAALETQRELEQELAAAGVKRALESGERLSFPTAEQARAGAQAAAERAAGADRRRSRAASQEARLRDDLNRVRQRADTCQRLLRRLPGHPDPAADADELVEDTEELDHLVERTERALQGAVDELQEVERRRSEVARTLRQVARDERWPDDAGRALRQTVVAHDELLELAEWAGAALGQIAARAAASAQELEHLEQRTSGVVDFFTQLTARFCGLLRRLSSVSRMPDGLGGWSGRSFISASVPARPTDAALRDRVERTLKAALNSEQDSRLRGADLLFRAIVAACEGRAPAIRFLKPDIGLPYQPVALGEGMSGGQGVTAAVALYCALANLRREAVAAQLTATGGGTLLLDNPFGKATSPELLSIMFRVAGRLGVQLICLTPSTEDAVVAQFPVLLQLRNSRGLRDGLRHVRVQEVRYRDALAQADSSISAVRLTRQDP
jgi:hypothetical protein